MTTPIVIVNHIDRIDSVWDLVRRVSPVLSIQVDQHSIGCAANHLLAYRRLLKWSQDYPDEPWVCVLEDDAIPCIDFRDQLEQALAVAPTPLVSLYLGRGRPPMWQKAVSSVIMPWDSDPNFLTTHNMLHTVGVAVHTDVLSDLVGFMERVLEDSPDMESDCVLSHFSGLYQKPVAYTRPSLVDHADTPSVIPASARMDKQERTEKRVAWIHDRRESWTATTLEIPDPYYTSL